MDGGDNTSKDYAPHMYVGDYFIHNTGKEFTIDGFCYYAGMTGTEDLVAERWTEQHPTRELLPTDEIPEEVRTTFSPTAFADGVAERATLVKMING